MKEESRRKKRMREERGEERRGEERRGEEKKTESQFLSGVRQEFLFRASASLSMAFSADMRQGSPEGAATTTGKPLRAFWM